MNGLAEVPEPDDHPGTPSSPDMPGDRDSGPAQPIRLLLSEHDRRMEHMLGYHLALELARVRPFTDSQSAARYAATTIDNSRALCGGNPKRHINLLRGQLGWLRKLPVGSSELRW